MTNPQGQVDSVAKNFS